MPRYYPLHAYYPLIPLLLCSFNAIAFILLSFLSLRNYRERKEGWGGNAYRALLIAFAVLYPNILAEEWAWATLHHNIPFLAAVEAAIGMLIPALVFHVFYKNERDYLPARRIWLICLVITYAMGLTGALVGVAASFASFSSLLWPNAVFLPLVFLTFAGTFGALSASRRPRKSPLERSQYRWTLLLICVWACVVILWKIWDEPWLVLAKDVCPLGFVFLVTYYVERYAFFDILIKKAAFIFSSLFLLTMYMVFMTPWMWSLPLRGWIASLIWGMSVWPIVLLAPWGQQRLSAWLDRVWLGRRLSPAEAGKYFFAGLQSAISEGELALMAGQQLGVIFQSDSEVSLSADDGLRENAHEVMQAPIRLHGEHVGMVRVYPRAHDPRFLSEDVALLSSLMEGFSFMLENLRLRGKHSAQERREQHLLLESNRSELRALRAQINPHFMFNALNTIAGLVRRSPDRAEQTIEQLAEVFRYTLHRSEREWVRLGEELDPVRAYLEIERTRFGDRLQFSIEADVKAGEIRIPAMIVQTLVENAVKHGIGAIRKAGVVEVSAKLSDTQLRIEVRDNGPGFLRSAAETLQRHEDGYGLRNVRERLSGYFGDAAHLSFERDVAPEMTVVAVEMPRAVQTVGAAP